MRAAEIRTAPRMPKNCTPALPADVPRLYEGYIPDTHRTPAARLSTREMTGVPPSSLIPGQRRWSNRIHVRGEPIPSRLRARSKAPACHRSRRRTMRASVRSGRSTSTGPMRAARRGRRVAAGRSAAHLGPARSRRRPMGAPRCPRGICTSARWSMFVSGVFWREDAERWGGAGDGWMEAEVRLTRARVRVLWWTLCARF